MNKTKDIKIVDNFLSHDGITPSKEYADLNKIITGNYFPWYYSDTVNDYAISVSSGDDSFQFIHGFYMGNKIISEYFMKCIDPILLKKIKILSLIRAKANLTPRTSKIEEVKPYHIDYSEKGFKNAFTSIYYLNTNDGYTKFENGDKVESVENSLVTFPNSLRHAGSTNNCDAMYRCVMNINWIKRNK